MQGRAQLANCNWCWAGVGCFVLLADGAVYKWQPSLLDTYVTFNGSLFLFRWRIKTSRTSKICRTSTTSKSTHWRTEVRKTSTRSQLNRDIMLFVRLNSDLKVIHISLENEINGMTQKELEKEKMTVGRMCFELKAKRQVSRQNESRTL